jgi:hypothetical protein
VQVESLLILSRGIGQVSRNAEAQPGTVTAANSVRCEFRSLDIYPTYATVNHQCSMVLSCFYFMGKGTDLEKYHDRMGYNGDD